MANPFAALAAHLVKRATVQAGPVPQQASKVRTAATVGSDSSSATPTRLSPLEMAQAVWQ
jgi:hypothetical protein